MKNENSQTEKNQNDITKNTEKPYEQSGWSDIGDLEGEVWRDVHSYEGLYQVSNLGNVRSITTKKTPNLKNNQKIIKLRKRKNGTRFVALCRNGKEVSAPVHRLVASSFLPNPESMYYVGHKNDNKTDNRVENLFWTNKLLNRLNDLPDKNVYQDEIWKDIIEYEDQYQISSYGRVKSLPRMDARNQFRPEKFLKLSTNPYLRATLTKNGKSVEFSVHRLVAQHFLDYRDGYEQLTVNHKDGNKLNNHFSNLEWCSFGDNNRHAYAIGLKDNKGEKHGESKLTNDAVKSIRFLSKIKWFRVSELSTMFDISQTLVRYVIDNKSWKHI